MWKPLPSRRVFKNFEGKPERESPKRPISANDGLERYIYCVILSDFLFAILRRYVWLVSSIVHMIYLFILLKQNNILSTEQTGNVVGYWTTRVWCEGKGSIGGTCYCTN